MTVGQRWVFATLLSVLATPMAAAAQMTCDPCRVGVVLDGPWERNDEVRGTFEREVLDLVGSDFNVQFPAAIRHVGDFSLSGVASGVDALLSDPDVDLVVTMGPVASTYAARLQSPSKPVVAVFVIEPQVQGIPVSTDDDGQRVSGVPNLSYVTFPSDIVESVRRLQEIVPFRNLTLLTSEGLAEAVPELQANLLQPVEGLDVELNAARVSTSVEAAIEAIPEDADAVYVYPLIQLPPGDFDRLVRALIDRGLPSFSYWGRREVEQGILASLFASEAFDRLGRRIALNVRRILSGEQPGTLPVDFERRMRLSLNVETAQAIGVYPSWSVWTEVDIVGDRERRFERQLTLGAAAEEAVAVNLDLMATQRFVAAGNEERRIARSVLYTQVSVNGFSEFIDSDRAKSLGGGPERLGVASANVEQLIYSDGALANVEIQNQLQLSRVQQLEETRLDIVFDAAVAYLDVLRAKSFEEIQRENLSVTRENLELAQVRQEIGVARPAEVVRWETQIANNRRNVIDAIAQRNVAEIQLNRLLNRPLEEPFQTEETDLDDPNLRTSAAQLGPYLGNPFAFDVFRDFMTAESMTQAPELQQIDAAIRAQERALTAAGRAFWAPNVFITGDIGAIKTGGAGTSFDLNLPFPIDFARPNSINWTVGVSASLPLFTGGARRAERAQTTEELEELRLSRRARAQQIEQRVRAALHAAGASFAGIDLAEAAAEAASRNLIFVTDAYEQGTASIIDLLDGQNQALVAQEIAANAVFDYLIDLMTVQRAVGRFDFFMTQDEHQAFLERLQQFFAKAGFDVRPGE